MSTGTNVGKSLSDLPIIKTVTNRAENTVPRRLRPILCLDDFEKSAKRHLPGPVFTYIESSVEDRTTFHSNRSVFDEIEFVPRVLVDTSKRSQKVKLFGKTYRQPFGIAPMGLSALAAFDGDVIIAKTASQLDIPSIMSAASLTKMERVADEGNGRWFQAYLPGENDRIYALLDRVEKCGMDTLVLTVDVPVSGNPENQLRGGSTMPLRPSVGLAWQGITHPRWSVFTALRTLISHGMPRFENMDAQPGPPILSRNLMRTLGNRDQLTWQHVDLIRKRWKGNLIIKGILAAQDAHIAKENGVDGIIVSNHGGRQLNGASASLRVLPSIVDAAQKIPVMIDSGFRRGSDVIKAYALGASYVFVGRPFLFAAAIGGAAGIQHAADLLSDEIDRNMAMLGVNEISAKSLADVVRDLSPAAGS